MKMKNKLTDLLLASIALIGLLSISACSKSAETKCQEMIGVDSSKMERGSGEEMAMKGCLTLSKQLPDAFNREYDAWKSKHDKAEK